MMRPVGQLLAETLPLALGAAVSPIVLAITIAMLTGTGRTTRALAFLAGESIPLLAFASLLLVFGASVSFKASPGAMATIDLVFGAVLLLVGLRALRHEIAERGSLADPGDLAEIHEQHAGVAAARAFAIGVGSMATNFTSLILYLPAMKTVAASPLALPDRLVVTVLVIAVVLSTVWLPLVLSLAAPDTADRVLSRAATAFHSNKRKVTIVLGLGFGAYLLLRGLGSL